MNCPRKFRSKLKDSAYWAFIIYRVREDNNRLKYENLLSKKVKDLEVLGQSLIYQERELLIQFKDRAEEEDLEENNQKYEKKRLLDISSSDGEDSDENDGFT